jgi:hypothetical protein
MQVPVLGAAKIWQGLDKKLRLSEYSWLNEYTTRLLEKKGALEDRKNT